MQAAPLPAQADAIQALPGLFGIEMRSANDGWIVGNYRTILHWNGTYWRQIPTPNHIGAVHDVSILNATDAWAIAGEGQGDVVLRWNGSSWQPIGLPQHTADLLTIDMLSPTLGWIGGYGGPYTWNGVLWAKDTDVFEVYSSAALSPTDVWMGGRNLYRYNGATWTFYDNKGVHSQDMMFSSPTDGWIVGGAITFCYQGDCIYEGATGHWDGNSWVRVAMENPTGAYMHGVWSSTTSGTWAVGGRSASGIVLRWNGAAWSELPVPAGVGTLSDIAMVSATDGWAVGFNGEILRWNGSQWNLWSYNIEQTYIPLTVGE
ncbi:MAG TPA: hypothetical protein VGD58_03560 [Herpetosiphonaceae bacterium]